MHRFVLFNVFLLAFIAISFYAITVACDRYLRTS